MVLINMCSPSVSTHTWVICGEPSGMIVASWQKAGSRSNFRKPGDMVCGMASPLGVGTVTEEYRQTRCLGALLARRVAVCRQGEVRREHLPRTWLNGPLPCSKRRGFKKEVEHIVPANGAFIRPCLPVGWPGPYRGDCSPLEGILVPLVGCISLEIS